MPIGAACKWHFTKDALTRITIISDRACANGSAMNG